MKIICLGDSFTEGFLVDKNYTDYLKEAGNQVINLGINGDRTKGMLKRFKPVESDILVVFGGTNDFFDSTPVEESFMNIKKILTKAKSKQIIVVIPPLMEEMEEYPAYQLMNNAINAYAKLLESLNADIIDAREIEPSYIDGLHMREDFHEKLSKEILKSIK